jgi:phosphoglycolate phosphatase
LIKAVVFDLDGTLLNTLEDLCNACNYALSKYNYPKTDIISTRKNIGTGIRNYILKSVNMDEAHVDSMYEYFKEYYQVHCNDYTRPYDGIPNILYKLKKDGYKLGLISNKSQYAVDIIIHKQFGDIFDVVYGFGEGFKRKPDPEMLEEAAKEFGISLDEFVYVGDSDVDVKTVSNAKCHGIFVSYGYRDKEMLLGLGASPIVDTPEEIYEKIKEL